METKFLRLRTSVEIGCRFGDWQVCWLGGWARFRLYFLVMLVKVPLRPHSPPPSAEPARLRGMEAVTCNCRHHPIAADLGDTVMIPIRNVDVAISIQRNSAWAIKRPRRIGARLANRRGSRNLRNHTIWSDFTDHVVVAIGEIEDIRGVDCNPVRPVQCGIYCRASISAVTSLSCPGECRDCALGCPQPYSIVLCVRDVQIAVRIQRDASREEQLRLSGRPSVSSKSLSACTRNCPDFACSIHKADRVIPGIGDVQFPVWTQRQAAWFVQPRLNGRTAVSRVAGEHRPASGQRGERVLVLPVEK